MYVTTTEAGEEIGLVVRDAQVITVLADRGEGRELVDHSADIELYEESKADLAAARAQLAQEPPNVTPLEQERRANAIRTINDWHRGIRITTKAVERAHNCLGINIGDPLPGEPPPPPPPPPVDVVEESRRKNAEHLIAKWRAGANYSNKVVKKAHAVLGIPFNPNETR